MCFRGYVFFLFLAAVPSAFPQVQSPTAAETAQWLDDKLNLSYPITWTASDPDATPNQSATLTQVTRFSGCRGSVRIRQLFRSGADLDLANYTFEASSLAIGTSVVEQWNKNQTSTPIIYNVRVAGTEGREGIGVLVASEQLANRVRNALLGLAKACGAKNEPY